MKTEQTIIATLSENYRTIHDHKMTCAVCGNNLIVEQIQVISDALATEWDIDQKIRVAFDYREGCFCRYCLSSVRIRNLAATLIETLNIKYKLKYCSIADLSGEPSIWNLQIAEINHCQTLHRYLALLHHLSYSEYQSLDPLVPSEDLTALSYADDSFDVVLMTDVLEHVPEYTKGLDEVRRVLAPEGLFLTTVPILTNRYTRTRAKKMYNGEINHLLTPSYHGDPNLRAKDMLVFHEFGIDFIDELTSRFQTRIYSVDANYGLVVSVFVCKKKGKDE
ncbi:MAG: class I SAM-dependent methyltransferase [Deltaproteobacteria bacterium]